MADFGAYQPVGNPFPLSSVNIEPVAQPDFDRSVALAGAMYNQGVNEYQRAFDQQITNAEKLRQQQIQKNSFDLLPPDATQFDLHALDQYQASGGDLDAILDPMTGRVDRKKLSQVTQARQALTALMKIPGGDRNVDDFEKRIREAFESQGKLGMLIKPDGSGYLSGAELYNVLQTSPQHQAILRSSPEAKNNTPADLNKSKLITQQGIDDIQRGLDAINSSGMTVGPLAGSAVGQAAQRAASAAGGLFGEPGWSKTFEGQRALQRITASSVLEKAATMKGQLSDKDVNFLRSSVPQLTDTEETWNWYLKGYLEMLKANKSIIEARERGMNVPIPDFSNWAASRPGGAGAAAAGGAAAPTPPGKLDTSALQTPGSNENPAQTVANTVQERKKAGFQIGRRANGTAHWYNPTTKQWGPALTPDENRALLSQ